MAGSGSLWRGWSYFHPAGASPSPGRVVAEPGRGLGRARKELMGVASWAAAKHRSKELVACG